MTTRQSGMPGGEVLWSVLRVFAPVWLCVLNRGKRFLDFRSDVIRREMTTGIDYMQMIIIIKLKVVLFFAVPLSHPEHK